MFVAFAGSHGLIALAWGVALNAGLVLGVPLFALIRYGHMRGTGRGGVTILPRLWKLVQSAAVPLALQGLYVIALRGASGLGTGNQTSLTYAYLIAATLVATTASSLSLISSAPLTRRGIDAESASAHVVHAAWLSLTVIAAAAGVFALVGGRLVVYLAPWMVASVAFSVTFPLLFVVEKPRVLVPLAVIVLLLHVPLSLALRAAFGLPGLAIALALSTFAVIFVLMAGVSRKMLVLSAVGLARTAAVVAAFALVTFGIPALAVGPTLAAPIGLVLYVTAFVVLRPRGVVDAWQYVRGLHH